MEELLQNTLRIEPIYNTKTRMAINAYLSIILRKLFGTNNVPHQYSIFFNGINTQTVSIIPNIFKIKI